MPRAHRYHVPGQIWHITHRCHEKAYLLKFPRDRRRYVRWLFEARKRFGLCVLDYMVTSNHVHLLVRDTGPDVIAQSMQLAAGRTAQEFNLRKSRKGAFWEDRYHATAVESGEHLQRCIVYIDLNMVRAGAVDHPMQWAFGGYHEIQDPPERYGVVDLSELTALSGFASVSTFQRAHRDWVRGALAEGPGRRDARWSEGLAVGRKEFVDQIKQQLGIAALHRSADECEAIYRLREPRFAWKPDFDAKSEPLS